jgi:hypothetical protein
VDKKKIVEKWKPILDNIDNNMDSEKQSWLSQYAEMHQLNEQTVQLMDNQMQQLTNSGDTGGFPSLLPLAMRVAAKTIAGGEYVESEERISRRSRVQKLKRILDSETFSSTVSEEEYKEIMTEKKDVWEDGLVSVQPLSAPTGKLFHMDFKYESTEEKAERIRKEREAKIERIFKRKTI